MNKTLTDEEVLEMLSNIANHSSNLWKIAKKLYLLHEEKLLPEEFMIPVSLLLSTVDNYIKELELMDFIERRTLQ